jgi:hypothetical protein
MMAIEARKHTSAQHCARARARNRTSVQLQARTTTSCAIALFAWLDNALHRANALFICRMQEMEFNIIDIIGATYAPRAYRRRAAAFDPPLAKGGRVQMLMTSPRTRTPYTPPDPFTGVLT